MCVCVCVCVVFGYQKSSQDTVSHYEIHFSIWFMWWTSCYMYYIPKLICTSRNRRLQQVWEVDLSREGSWQVLCAYACARACACAYAFACACAYACACACMHARVRARVHVRVRVRVSVCVRVRVHMYICAYVCTCVCVRARMCDILKSQLATQYTASSN